MESIVNKCSEARNSTDCLLRVLITFLEEIESKNDQEYNWDPITFGFTVAISLSAALFALLTIFQAVLAAGPGRRKSDSRAIGRWAAKTEWKWSLYDFSFIHVTNTPILTLSEFESFISMKVDQEAEGSEKAGDPTQTRKGPLNVAFNLWSETVYTVVDLRLYFHFLYASGRMVFRFLYNFDASFSSGPAASWVHFLNTIGLGDVDMALFPRRKNNADYIPGDMMAVPAYADIGFIVTAMSISGAHLRICQDEAYPSMRGNTCQFDIRQHATLGIIGYFFNYSVHEAQYHGRISKEEAKHRVTKQQLAIANANGFIELRSCLMERVNANITLENKDDRLREYFQSHKLGCSTYRSWLFSPPQEHIYLLKFIGASTPILPPLVFPWENLQLTQLLNALTLNSIRFTPLDFHKPPLHLTDLICKHGEIKCTLGDRLPNAPCPCQWIFSCCAKALESEASFRHHINGLSNSQRSQLRDHISSFLRDLDTWLNAKEASEELDRQACLQFKLYGDTLVLLHIVKSVKSKPWRSSDDLPCLQWLENGLQQFFTQKLPEMIKQSPSDPNRLQSLADCLHMTTSTQGDPEKTASFLNHLLKFSG